MPYFQTSDQTEIHYHDWGSGSPIVLIHGWPVSGEMWEKQAEFLAGHGYRVITYDRRGFGQSSKPWSGYDYDTFADDLKALLDNLNLQDVTLAGFSMGGGEVARYLSRHGDRRIARAVLISAVTPFLLKTADNPEGIEASEFEKIEGAIRKDRPAFLKDFGQKFFGQSLLHHAVSDAVLEWMQMLALAAPLRSTLAAAKAWSTTDFRADLAKIKVPVLVIHGNKDATVPIEKSAAKTIELLPNARLLEYDGEPHGLFITSAERLNRDLMDFMEGTVTQEPVQMIVDAPLVEQAS